MRRAGYPNRVTYDAFVREFACLEAAPDPPAAAGTGDTSTDRRRPSSWARDDEELAVELLLLPAVAEALGGGGGGGGAPGRHLASFRPGRTVLFLGADAPYALRNLRRRLLAPAARTLQRWWAGRLGSAAGREWRRARAEVCHRFSF